MLNIGPQELLLILVVALLVVGPRRLPEIGRSLGKGLREIRKAQDEVRKTIQVNLDDETPSARTGARPRVPDSEVPDARPPTPASEPIGEVSKTLGRGLAELRKARREIERSFRVDLDQPAARPSPAPPAEPSAAPEAEGPRETGPLPAAE